MMGYNKEWKGINAANRARLGWIDSATIYHSSATTESKVSNLSLDVPLAPTHAAPVVSLYLPPPQQPTTRSVMTSPTHPALLSSTMFIQKSSAESIKQCW
jgi:hypothetical protein